MTAKLKKILVYAGVSAAGIFSIFLLVSFITAQVKLVQVLSPPAANSPDSVSRASQDSFAPESLPSSGGPTPGYGNPSEPATGPSGQPLRGRPGIANPDPGSPSAPPGSSGADWPAGVENSQGNPSGQVSSPSESGVGQNRKTSEPFNPPHPSWNKPFAPYKGYQEGEQPPWARPTKTVIETRKNDPNFNLLDSLDKRRKEIMQEQEQAEKEQNR